MQIRSEDSNLQINVIARSNPNSDDYWDANWLESEIRISAPGINVLSGISLRAEDFLRFYGGLKKMQDGQMQEVEFTTMEEGIYLKGKLDITGNIKWEGIVKLGTEGNSLTFAIETDYASIERLSAEISEVLNRYPVIGNVS
jgi:hypothetical protein